MSNLWRAILGALVGCALGLVVVAFGTHGTASESEEHRHAEHSFFWVKLYDASGTPEAVRAIERASEIRLNVWAGCVGALFGAGAGLSLFRGRAGEPRAA